MPIGSSRAIGWLRKIFSRHSDVYWLTMKEFGRVAALCSAIIISIGTFAQQKNSEYLSELTHAALRTYLNKPDSSIRLSKHALEISIANRDVYYEGYAYYLLSKAFWVKANYRLSTEYGFKALHIFQESPHRTELASTWLSLARTLVELGNYGEARQMINNSLEISTADKNEQMIAESVREMSYLLTEQGKLDSALMYADRGIALFEKLGDSLDISILYSRKSRIYFAKKDFENSRKFAYRGMHIDTIVGNRRALAISYFQAAQNEHALKNGSNAERLLSNSIRINSEIGNLSSLIRAHELLATVYLETQRPQLAAHQLQLASQYKDSLYNSEKSGQIQEMQSLYELEGKENKIKLLEQENALRDQEVSNQKLFLAVMLVGMLLLVALLFFLTRLRRIQYKTNQDLALKNVAIEQQKEEMQAQAEKVQQLNQLQSKLFSVISHDLRGPISNLQALLELLTKKLMTADEFVSISDKLKTNLNVTQRTLENLLNWSLSQMDGIKTEKKHLDINQCIDEACKLMDEAAIRKNIIIRKVWDETLVVAADPDQLQLILRNLIHNGIKFSRAGDELRISAIKQRGQCHVSIHDTGMGMSDDEIETVLGSREHFTKRGTQQEKGTGLGLLLCKEFIERNGGKMFINSKPGHGTEVSFTLNLA